MVKLLTIEEIKQRLMEEKCAYLKYVRVKDEYRFVFSNEIFVCNHSQMIAKNETAQSAAYCTLRDDKVTVNGNSMTLKLYPLPDDEQKIQWLIFNDVSQQDLHKGCKGCGAGPDEGCECNKED